MKKIIIAISMAVSLLYTGCYDPDTATVRINLGNMPIAKHEPVSFIDRVLGLFAKDAYAQTVYDFNGVTKVHIGAYSGNSIVSSVSIDAADVDTYLCGAESTCSSIEVNVPAGENITILVVGEYPDPDSGDIIAEHFGVSEPVTLKPGETTNVAINVYPRYIWSESYSISYETGTKVASWSRPETTIPAKLVLYYYNVNSSGDGPITATYECSGTSMNLSQPMISCEETISLRLAFEEFNITTGSLVSYSVGGCK